MTIIRQVTLIIPNTDVGRQFAKDYEATLKAQLAHRGTQEDTQNIIVKSEFTMEVDDG